MADNGNRKLEDFLIDGLRGVELSEIARRRGVSRQAIYQLLHKRLKKRFAEQYQQLKEKYQIEKNLPLWVLRVEHTMFTETGDRRVRSKRGVPERNYSRRTISESGRRTTDAEGQLQDPSEATI